MHFKEIVSKQSLLQIALHRIQIHILSLTNKQKISLQYIKKVLLASIRF